MRVKVIGKIEGSAADVPVIACSAAKAYRGSTDAPCDGEETARKTLTVAGGRFVLQDMPIAPMQFWINRRGWREVTHAPCCAQLGPDSTFDIGTLRLE